MLSRGNYIWMLSRGNYIWMLSRGNHIWMLSRGNYIWMLARGNYIWMLSRGNYICYLEETINECYLEATIYVLSTLPAEIMLDWNFDILCRLYPKLQEPAITSWKDFSAFNLENIKAQTIDGI